MSQLALDLTGAAALAEVRARHEGKSAEWLAAMRAEARRLAGLHGQVTADDLRPYREALAARGLTAHPNTAGTIFATRGWEQIGWTKSVIAHAHRNDLRVWRWRGED